MQGMVIDMEEARLQTLAQVRAFLDGTTEMAFRVPKAEQNQFIERVLKRFGFAPRFTRISIAVHTTRGTALINLPHCQAPNYSGTPSRSNDDDLKCLSPRPVLI